MSRTKPTSVKIKRVTTPVADMPLDSNIRPLYAIEQAAWVWHPDCPQGTQAVLQFYNTVKLKSAARFKMHMSADQRYEFYVNGQFIDMGPDRGDIQHWPFTSYRVDLPAGNHRVEIVAYWIGDNTPVAQQSLRGGLIVKAEGPLSAQLDTGSGKWRCRPIRGWSFADPRAVGASHHIDLNKQTLGKAPAKKTEVIVRPLKIPCKWGAMRNSWRLYPTNLPAQTWAIWKQGYARAVCKGGLANRVAVTPTQAADPGIAKWTAFLQGRGGVKIAPGETYSVLFDLEDYVCAFPFLELSGEGQASIRWAESLYAMAIDGKRPRDKGNRNEIEGKCFIGLEDTVAIDSPRKQVFRPFWWRAGRYVLLTLHAGEKTLAVHRLTFRESRYPLENEGRARTGARDLDRLQPLLARGVQMCAHETFMDCPYYEQLMYVGDTRLELLTTYVMTRDDRLVRRCIELFDFSRHYWGMVAEHYPSRSPQQSPTFSCIWATMVKDYALWRDDRPWVRQRMVGVRSMLEVIANLVAPSGILEQVPGWPFCDWVDSWEVGYPPGSFEGKASALINLFYIQALDAAAQLEDYMAEPLRAKQYRQMAQAVAKGVMDVFWDEQRGMLADDVGHNFYSEQVQCIALLSGVLSARQRRSAVKCLLEVSDLARASIYFSHYLFDALYHCGLGEEVVKRMETWQVLAENGLCTPIEQPEPSRSDCHAWGSHPLFHYHASLCGIRPGDFGFRTVEIVPQPGPLEALSARTPHPRGWICAKLNFDHTRGRLEADITLPRDTTGCLRWNNRTQELLPGHNRLLLD